jgi:two-component system NtrC family sensor kinase
MVETHLRTRRSRKEIGGETARALRERIKELTCLYRISQISGKNYVASDAIFQSIVEAIPPAWQNPAAAAARIVVDGRSFYSINFKESRIKMTTPVIYGGKHRGLVEVAYLQRSHEIDDTRFIKEERNLLKAIARQVGFIIERQQADSEKSKLHKQLIHADRLATIGQLAAGVAHELNEPLSNILGFAQLAGKHPELPEKSAYDLEKIVHASLYAREIIKKLLLFARQTTVCKSSIDLNDTVSAALELFEYRFEKEGIKLVRGFSPELPPLVADGGQLKQVIVNLVVNAIQAMPGGGILTVRTSTEGKHLVCSVEDTGTGMAEEIIDRIFVPFFTTKDVDQGTGLGLPVAHGIVVAHGGTIEVKSAPGKGATFTIRLPAGIANEREKVDK